MKPDRERANAWSHLSIGAAIEVHRIKGPGLIESIYSKCFLRECELRSIPVRRELLVPIEYKGHVFEEPLRLDFLVDDLLILEFKVVEEVMPIHKAQLLSYNEVIEQTVRPPHQLSRNSPERRNYTNDVMLPHRNSIEITSPLCDLCVLL